jgi:hypothetical protein
MVQITLHLRPSTFQLPLNEETSGTSAFAGAVRGAVREAFHFSLSPSVPVQVTPLALFYPEPRGTPHLYTPWSTLVTGHTARDPTKAGSDPCVVGGFRVGQVGLVWRGLWGADARGLAVLTALLWCSRPPASCYMILGDRGSLLLWAWGGGSPGRVVSLLMLSNRGCDDGDQDVTVLRSCLRCCLAHSWWLKMRTAGLGVTILAKQGPSVTLYKSSGAK